MQQSAVKIWREQKQIKNILGKKGKILSWTEIFVAPPKFSSDTPYSVVLVELENGQRVYGQLVDFSKKSRSIGQKVISILRRGGEVSPEDVIEYGVKFKPL